MASDAEDHTVAHEIQKTHVQILNSAGKNEFNCASALNAQLNFDKIARKFLKKYDYEAKLLKHGANEKIDLDVFHKDFDKEFIPEFSEKIFEIIYDYNHSMGKRKRKKKKDKNLLGVGDEKDDAKEAEVQKKISRMDAQRFIKSTKDVRKHIREKSLVPLESIFNATQFSDISENVGKVSYDDFKSVFEAKLGKKQCQQAFDLMKDKSDQISIVAYNNFRDKGIRKLLGDAGKEDAEDADDAEADADAPADDKDKAKDDAPAADAAENKADA